MQLNIVIDDKLMQQACLITNLQSEQEIIEEALRAWIIWTNRLLDSIEMVQFPTIALPFLFYSLYLKSAEYATVEEAISIIEYFSRR